MKKVVEQLGAYAQKKHKDISLVFEDMLDFFIDSFSLDRLLQYKMDYAAIFEDRKKENEVLSNIMYRWIALSEEEVEKEGAFDFFGLMYEEVVKGKFKSSSMGQFFTPMSLCLVMADVLDVDGCKIMDDACGSGRTLLAHFAKSDKSKFNYYIAADLDPISVKMCALNMMINGMIGEVKHMDSLTGETFMIYKINEIKYPIPNPACGIRIIHPVEINNANEIDSPPLVKLTPQFSKQKPKEKGQLTLF